MLKRILILSISIILIIGVAGGCSSGSKNKIVVASKQYTENIILSEIFAQLIEEKTDLKVVRKQNLGGTSVILPAMKAKDIDFYVEYTGTICGEILKMDTSGGFTAEEALINATKGAQEELDFTYFPPLLLNNTYAIGLPRAKAQELGITKLSELKEHAPNLVFGSSHIFYTRIADGYDAMVELYDLQFKEALKMDQALMYEASASGEIDVINAFATDGLLAKYDIFLLEDDKGLFPPYQGAPLCRNDVLEAHPELNDVLGLLGGTIDDVAMQKLNYKVDVENRSIEDTAREYLKENGYID